MIITLLLNLIILIIGMIFIFLPVVTLADIPLFGGWISEYLLTIVQMWNSFCETFPYAITAWRVFLYLIIPFEILLIIARFFLGSRTPINHK
jgi:hypothetical protein